MKRRSPPRRCDDVFPSVPVEVADAIGEEVRTLETLADLLGMAGDGASADRRTLHALALTIRGACRRMRGAMEA